MTLFSELADGLNEMLLQSHDGTIRIAPAAGRRSARLTLHAAGGFIVSAEIDHGVVRWVAIRSRLGQPCRLQNPWEEAFLHRNNREVGRFADSVVLLDTRPDDLLIAVPERGLFAAWQTETARYAPNQREKHCPVGKNILGLPRLF